MFPSQYFSNFFFLDRVCGDDAAVSGGLPSVPGRFDITLQKLENTGSVDGCSAGKMFWFGS